MLKNKKQTKYIILFVILMSLSVLIFAFAKSGREIIEESNDRPSFIKSYSELEMVIYKENGDTLEKEIKSASYTENYGTDNEISKSILTFTKPRDDDGNSILTISYDDESKEDLRLLYLKALKKPKRIAGSERGSDFMGSDFSNEDIGRPDIDDYKYELIREEADRYKLEVNGKMKNLKLACYVVKAEPANQGLKRDIGFNKKIMWIEKSTYLTLKTDYYDLSDTKFKQFTLDGFIITKNSRGEKVYFIKGMTMKNLKQRTRTEIEFKNIKTGNNAGFRTNIFDEQYLTRKWW